VEKQTTEPRTREQLFAEPVSSLYELRCELSPLLARLVKGKEADE